MRRHSKKPLLEVGYVDEESLEPSAREAAELGGHQCFGAVGVSLVMGQSEKVSGKKKSGDLPPAIAEELIDLHCAGSDVEDVFGGVSFIEYRRMRLDVEGAHDCCKALLFLAGQWGTRRELTGSASVARSNEMQRMGTGSINQAEARHGAVCVTSECRAMHRITLTLSALRHRRRGRVRLQPFDSPYT